MRPSLPLRPARAFVLLVILVVGCDPTGSGEPSVLGAPEDAKVTDGLYGGYRVIRPCDSKFRDIGIRGQGPVKLEQVADIGAAGAEIYQAVHSIDSVHGGAGYGLGCEAVVIGTSVALSDWRDVDAVVTAVSRILIERGWDLEVGISVEPISVPH